MMTLATLPVVAPLLLLLPPLLLLLLLLLPPLLLLPVPLPPLLLPLATVGALPPPQAIADMHRTAHNPIRSVRIEAISANLRDSRRSG